MYDVHFKAFKSAWYACIKHVLSKKRQFLGYFVQILSTDLTLFPNLLNTDLLDAHTLPGATLRA